MCVFLLSGLWILSFCASSNPVSDESEIRVADDLLKCCRLEIKLNTFHLLTMTQHIYNIYIYMYIYIYIYYIYILYISIYIHYILLKTFPGPGYLRSEDAVVWLSHSLVNLYIYGSTFHLATAQSLWAWGW